MGSETPVFTNTIRQIFHLRDAVSSLGIRRPRLPTPVRLYFSHGGLPDRLLQISMERPRSCPLKRSRQDS